MASTTYQAVWIAGHYARRLALVNAIKVEQGCIDCGYNAHPAALDFDHRPGTERRWKGFGENLSRSWDVVLDEISKCDVRCANCHRVISYERRQATKIVRTPEGRPVEQPSFSPEDLALLAAARERLGMSDSKHP
jgi:hypothetical protein